MVSATLSNEVDARVFGDILLTKEELERKVRNELAEHRAVKRERKALWKAEYC